MKKARKDKSRTRDSLAEQVGISPRHLSAIENGEKRPSIEVLRKIIHCLGISADRVFYPDLDVDTDAQQIMRLYDKCSDHDKQIIKAVINAALQNKYKRAGELGLHKSTGSASGTIMVS